MHQKSLFKFSVVLAFIWAMSPALYAQGDGPRAHLFAPTGVWAVNPKYLNLNQNLLPAGNILVEELDVRVNVFPTTFIHSFAIKKRLARIYAMINPGSFTASTNIIDVPIEPNFKTSGFSDGFIAFELGLVGAPALNAVQFSKHQPKFSLMGYFRYWYSGTYNSNDLLNLGSNRSTFEIAAPMAIPFHDNPKDKATWLEIFPSLQIYSDNNDPARGSFTEKVSQDPLLIIESHLTHNFTKKLWIGADLRFQYGGSTYADGVSDDNLISALGGGLSAGYQILPSLSGFAGYGTVLTGQNNIQADMLRLSLVFSYINLKKSQVK